MLVASLMKGISFYLATLGYVSLLIFQNKKLLDIQLIVKLLSSLSYLKKDRKAHVVRQKGNKIMFGFFFLESHLRDLKVEVGDYGIKLIQTGNLLCNEIQLAPQLFKLLLLTIHKVVIAQ